MANNDTPKLRVYILSLLAFRFDTTMIATGNVEGGARAEHVPGIQPAHSMDEAIGRGMSHALSRWKTSDGWYGHAVAAESVTEAFYDAAYRAAVANIVGVDDEPPRVQRNDDDGNTRAVVVH